MACTIENWHCKTEKDSQNSLMREQISCKKWGKNFASWAKEIIAIVVPKICRKVYSTIRH